MPGAGLAVEQAQHPAVEPDHHGGIECGKKRLPHAEPEIDAGHRLAGIGQIDQNSRIEPEAPMLVQRQIDTEDHGRKYRNHHEIGGQQTPPHPLRKADPERQQRDEQRYGRHISGHGGIEPKPVEKHPQPTSRAGSGGFGTVPGHENGFLDGHGQYGRTENTQHKGQFTKSKSGFHSTSFSAVFPTGRAARPIRVSHRRQGHRHRRCPAQCTSER